MVVAPKQTGDARRGDTFSGPCKGRNTGEVPIFYPTWDGGTVTEVGRNQLSTDEILTPVQ